MDATRGLAMVGVFVSHFGIAIGPWYPETQRLLATLTLFASPTFMLLSGAMLGYLLAAPRDVARVRRLMADRALFLLTVAHAVILVAHRGRLHGVGDAFTSVFMTDTIGLAVLAGLVIIPRTQARARLGIALGLFAFAWLSVCVWMPGTPMGEVAKSMLFGDLAPRLSSQISFPVFPWVSVFLVGSLAGPTLRRLDGIRAMRRLGFRLFKAGAAAVTTAAAVKAAYIAVRPTVWVSLADLPRGWRALYLLTTPFTKHPPGPAYLLAFGGVGLVLGGCCLMLATTDWAPALLQWPATIGRASLFTFTLQYYVFYLVMPVRPAMGAAWLAMELAVATSLLWLAAWAWNRWVGNGVLTVGLRQVLTPSGAAVR